MKYIVYTKAVFRIKWLEKELEYLFQPCIIINLLSKQSYIKTNIRKLRPITILRQEDVHWVIKDLGCSQFYFFLVIHPPQLWWSRTLPPTQTFTAAEFTDVKTHRITNTHLIRAPSCDFPTIVFLQFSVQ